MSASVCSGTSLSNLHVTVQVLK